MSDKVPHNEDVHQNKTLLFTTNKTTFFKKKKSKEKKHTKEFIEES